MRKSSSFLKTFLALLLTTFVLKSCIIPSTLDNPVVMWPGESKTFSVIVSPNDATYAWFVDGVTSPGANTNSFTYVLNDFLPSLHTLKVIAYHPASTAESYTWNIKYEGKVFQAELVVRSAENISDHNSVLNLVNSAKLNNIQTLVIAAKQDEDDEFDSGTVFYQSAIAPLAFPGFDALKDTVTEAHKVGIQVKAWIPQFHDRIAFNKNTDWRMKAWVNGQAVDYKGTDPKNPEFFVNPLHPDVQQYELSIIKEVVSNYELDGVVLDWIRFDEWNMDLSQKTRDSFKAVYGYDPATINFSIDSAQLVQWQDWRTSRLADYVGTVRNAIKAIKPNLSFGIYILPPEFVEVGQDAAKLKGYMDFVSPMCYWTDWGKTVDWVYNGVMADTRAKVGASVKMIPTIDISYTDDQYKNINAGIRARHPDVKTIGYFYYANWTDAQMKLVDKIRKY